MNTFLQILRRFLLLQAFMLWQGGFVFYSAVVVPIGTEYLGSATDQGFITQKVSHWINAFGAFWHLLFIWELLHQPDPSRRRTQWRFGLWLASFGLLLALFWLHPRLDALLDPETFTITEYRPFRRWHIAYLWTITVQWIIVNIVAWLTLCAWNAPKA